MKTLTFDAVEFIGKMMSLRTLSQDVAAVNQGVAYLKGYLEAQGLYCSEEELDGRRILYASTVAGKVTDILLNSHLDVVPPNNPEKDHCLVQEGTTLKGRGTEDCLGNAAAVIQCLLACKGKIGIAAVFTTDEEIGGETTDAMVKRGYAARKMAIVMDGGAYSIATAQKGILILKLTAHGKGGHSSEPWCFDNPILKLMDGLAKLRQAWPPVSATDRWHDTMAPCVLEGGSANNQIPDTASLILNIRYVNEAARDAILEKVRTLTGLEVKVDRECPPVFTDESHPMMQLLMSELQAAFPEKTCNFYRMDGATDARHLKAMGVPVAIMGVRGGGAHSANEWSDLDSIRRYAEFLAAFAQKLD